MLLCLQVLRNSGNPFENIKMKIAFFEVYQVVAQVDQVAEPGPQEEIYDLLKKDPDGSLYLPNGGGASGAAKISGREQRHLDRHVSPGTMF